MENHVILLKAYYTLQFINNTKSWYLAGEFPINIARNTQQLVQLIQS